MAEVKWIKIVTDIFDDEKILLIESMPEADSIIVIWFKLLCLAGKQNNGGVLMFNDRIAYSKGMLSTIFRRKETIVDMALRTFEQFGMIEIIDGAITIPNWSKHQSLESFEKRKEYMKNYMVEYRTKQKEIACKPNSKPNVSILDKDIDIDIDKDIEVDIEVDKDNMSKSKRFVPPTVDEVKAYCKERNNDVDAEKFVNFYQSKGWMIGKSKMKDFKAAVRTWEKSSPKKVEYTTTNISDDDVDVEELRKRIFKK